MMTLETWVGIDVGGTMVEAIAVDMNFDIQASYEEAFVFDAPLDQLIRVVNQVGAGLTIAAIGVGFPGQIDAANGVALQAVNLIKEPLPIADGLREAFGVPVFVENDCNVFVLGANMFLHDGTLDSAAFITIGTGLGVGLLLNGQLFRGANGLAGELGHVVVAPESDVRCGCGNRGCLETVVSGTAIARMGQAYADELANEAGRVSAETIAQAARAGNTHAIAIFDEVGRTLGTALQSLIMHLDPEKIFLGGGVMRAADLISVGLFAEWERQRALSPFAASQLQDDRICVVPQDFRAGVKGAVALIHSRLSEGRQKFS